MSGAELASASGALVAELSDTFLAHREGKIVVFEVYLDESGTHHDSQIVGVGAAWADKSEWTKWTRDWNKAKWPIRVHHSVDCHNRVGEWDGWCREQRDNYVRRILPVIERHEIRGVISAVDKGEITRVLKEKHNMVIAENLMVRGWYFICLVWAIRSAWEALAREGVDNIAFVHEQNEFGHEAQEAFSVVQARMADSNATFGIGSKAVYPPLQCADILAYEGNHQMRDFKRPLRKPLMAIDRTFKRFYFKKYDKTEVSEIVDFTAHYLNRILAEFSKSGG
ncbi:MAG: hypothetical protein VX871_07685 [Pseudomonadota bacterium]|nr:hypothetical protein [Pseudomonadota bacterium]